MGSLKAWVTENSDPRTPGGERREGAHWGLEGAVLPLIFNPDGPAGNWDCEVGTLVQSRFVDLAVYLKVIAEAGREKRC